LEKEITFLASLPDLQSAITLSGRVGDGARIRLDLPGMEKDAALWLAYHARGRLLEVTIKFADADNEPPDSDESAKRGPAKLDKRRGQVRRD
jgi:hypothetical protein